MQIFYSTLEAMAFLLGIGCVGFFILARRVVGENIIHVLSPLVLLIAVPCLVFGDIIIKFDPRQVPGWWSLPLFWVAFTAATLPLSIISGFCVEKEFRREFIVSLFYPNAVFIPLAVLTRVYGTQSLLVIELFLLTLFFPGFLFNTFNYFFSTRQTEPGRLNTGKILHPVVFATVFAVFLRLMNWQEAVPDVVLRIVQSLGTLALPLIMLLIGGSLYLDYQKKETIHWKAMVIFIAIKNGIFPALTLLIIGLFMPPQPLAILLFLQSAVPPVTTIPVLTGQAGGQVSLTNQFFIGSFVASVVSIPAGMVVITMLYTGRL